MSTYIDGKKSIQKHV